MNPLIVVTDVVLDDIERFVAAHAPERGGALLGPVGQPVISTFLYDAAARTSGSTFSPSAELQRQVSAIESTDETLELKGMVHSHPGAMNHPSSGDQLAYEDSLRGAPWLGQFVCPIVTHQRPAGAHELGVPSGRVSFFVAHPSGGPSANLSDATVRTLPLLRDGTALTQALGGGSPSLGTVNVDGQVYLTSSLDTRDGSVQLLVTAGYPTDAPLLLVTRHTESLPEHPLARALLSLAAPQLTKQVPLAWSLEDDDETRLIRAVQAACVPRPQVGRAGAPVGVLTTTSELTTSTADPAVRATNGQGDAPSVPTGTAREGIRARLTDVASERIASRRVLLVGCGSGGSLTAEMLVRSGVEHLALIDADLVSAANLSRSVYTASDIDDPKVQALTRRLTAINPDVSVETIQERLQDLDGRRINELVQTSDLVIAATDDPNAQRLLNHYAFARQVPALFGGVYARGLAGEVVFTVPGLTPCYRCVTSTRHVADSSAPTTDYGTGRLTGEPALGADIAHIVTASVKLAMGLLQVEDDIDNTSKTLLIDALSTNSNFLILSTVPKWDFFGPLFAEVPGQLAYQSVWLSSVRDPGCPVCGDNPVDPLTVPVRGPQVLNLRAVRQLATAPPAADTSDTARGLS